MIEKKVNEDNEPLAFSFGEPESVLTTNLTDYLGVFMDLGESYYEPPVSLRGLSKLTRANSHHSAALYIKRNAVIRYYIDNEVLTTKDLSKAAYEYHAFGMCYFKKIKNRLGDVLRFESLPAIYMRRMKEKDRFLMLKPDGSEIKFKTGEVALISEYDVNQNIYGVPQYLAGIQSLLLNEDATLFRRRYYKNGAHMGFIFYVGGAMEQTDIDTLKESMSASKGVGNFKSLFLNLPKGNKDSVKIVPIGDIGTKDEFERIKNITRNDIISIHRLHPALASIMPENQSGFGDITKVNQVYYENEIVPMQMPFLELNALLKKTKHIDFRVPEFTTA